VVPNGSIGFRWSEEGRWNLHLKDSATDAAIDPLLSFAPAAERWSGCIPRFSTSTAPAPRRVVPIRQLQTPSGPVVVTTVFDLLAAHLGVRRKETDAHPEDYPSGYDDPQAYTPAWQEAITGVPAADAIRVAASLRRMRKRPRQVDDLPRRRHQPLVPQRHDLSGDPQPDHPLRLPGVNGGGWAHYVGQEKVRPQSAWSQVAFGLDWRRPPRQQNGTSLWYFATDQWRYDTLTCKQLPRPWPKRGCRGTPPTAT